MANPRPYLRSARKIEWDSAFGKILARPERKTKFSETRQFAEIGRRVRDPRATRRPSSYFDSATLCGQDVRGRFGNFRVFFLFYLGL